MKSTLNMRASRRELGYAPRAYPALARQALGLLGASHAELMLHHHARSAPLCEAPLARREGRERVGAREEVEQRVDAGEVAVGKEVV